MNRIFFFVFVCFSFLAPAQKIGVVDTNYLLGRMPQYKEAESRLNAQVTSWQVEIQGLQSEFERKKTALDNERVLLVGDQLRTRENEVSQLEQRIKSLITQRFGTEGEISKMRSAFVKPFQDQIWTAIKTVSEKNNLGIVLDKSNNISVIFLDKRYDFTDKVLDELVKNQRK